MSAPRLLLLIVEERHKEEAEVLLHRAGAGYTEVGQASGAGSTGPRLASRVFPKSSALILSFVDDELLVRLRAEIAALCAASPGGLRAVVLDVAEVIE